MVEGVALTYPKEKENILQFKIICSLSSGANIKIFPSCFISQFLLKQSYRIENMFPFNLNLKYGDFCC